MSKFCFDTHMHFDLYSNRNNVLDFVESINSYTIAVTNLPDLYEKYLHTNKKMKFVQLALGFHPQLCFQYKHQINKFDQYLATTRFVGEVGLDYSTTDADNHQAQEMIFSHIIQECNKAGKKVLTIHSRKAEKKVLEILDGLSSCSVIMHWYSGSLKVMDEAIKRGYYFSVNHQMFQSTNGRKIVERIPDNKILIESDAPFTNGLDNEYSVNFIDEIYQYLCDMKGLTEDELTLMLKNNFRELMTKYQ